MKIPRPVAPPERASSDLETEADKIRELIVAGELESAMEHLESTLGEKRDDSTPSSISSYLPSVEPGDEPSHAPSDEPSHAPSHAPSRAPSHVPAADPTRHGKAAPATPRRFGGPRLWAGIAAIATLAVLAIVVGLALRSGDEDAPVAAAREAAAVAAPVADGPVAAPALEGPTGVVAINAVPWGEVTEITDAEGYLRPLPPVALTPLRLELPPGNYVIHLQHPDHPEPETCPVEVGEGRLATCNVTFGDVAGADAYFLASGWWS